LDLYLGIKINDAWKVCMKTQSQHTFKASATDLYTANESQLYFTGPIFDTTVSAGLIPLATSDALLIANTNISGAQWTFGEKFQTIATIGRLPVATPSWYVSSSDSAPLYRSVQFIYAPFVKTTFLGAYHYISHDGDSKSIAEVGFNTQLSENFGFKTYYAQSDVDNVGDSNKSYLAQLTYKAVKLASVGSYDIFLNRTRLPLYAQIATNMGWCMDKEQNQIGFDYVPAKNMLVTVFYVERTVIDDLSSWGLSAGEKEKGFRAQVEVFF